MFLIKKKFRLEDTVTLVDNLIKLPEIIKYEWKVITNDFFESIKGI